MSLIAIIVSVVFVSMFIAALIVVAVSMLSSIISRSEEDRHGM